MNYWSSLFFFKPFFAALSATWHSLFLVIVKFNLETSWPMMSFWDMEYVPYLKTTLKIIWDNHTVNSNEKICLRHYKKQKWSLTVTFPMLAAGDPGFDLAKSSHISPAISFSEVIRPKSPNIGASSVWRHILLEIGDERWPTCFAGKFIECAHGGAKKWRKLEINSRHSCELEQNPTKWIYHNLPPS